jgi:uncharacterized protein YuzE
VGVQVRLGLAMQITHDPEADAAYIYLGDTRRHIDHSDMYDSEAENAAVIVQFDEDNRVVGIEMLGVSRLIRDSDLSLAMEARATERFTYDLSLDVAKLLLHAPGFETSESRSQGDMTVGSDGLLILSVDREGFLTEIEITEASGAIRPDDLAQASQTS